VTDAERVAACRRFYDAFGRQDLDTLKEIFAPDCEWVSGVMAPIFGSAAVHGHAGVEEVLRFTHDMFDGYWPEIVEARAADGDRVLIRAQISGRSPGGMDVGQYMGQIVDFRDSRIARVTQTDAPPPGWDDARAS
jgi:ketosteroid isomerase-like protein